MYPNPAHTPYGGNWSQPPIDHSNVADTLLAFQKLVPSLFTPQYPKRYALDIGAGNGPSAIYLARHGFDVTAVDPTEDGIQNLVNNARKIGVIIDPVKTDLANFKPRKSADLVVCINVLSHLKASDIQRSLELMTSYTAKDGYHVIKTSCADGRDIKSPDVFRNTQLIDFYNNAGWNVLVNAPRPAKRTFEHHEMDEMPSYIIHEVIAQKK